MGFSGVTWEALPCNQPYGQLLSWQARKRKTGEEQQDSEKL